jgi:hypothetical protein
MMTGYFAAESGDSQKACHQQLQSERIQEVQSRSFLFLVKTTEYTHTYTLHDPTSRHEMGTPTALVYRILI